MIMAWTIACPAARIAAVDFAWSASFAASPNARFHFRYSMKDFCHARFDDRPFKDHDSGPGNCTHVRTQCHLSRYFRRELHGHRHPAGWWPRAAGRHHRQLSIQCRRRAAGAAVSRPALSDGSSGYAFLAPSFPGRTVTSSVFYGPNTPLFDPDIGAGNVRAVGSYKFAEGGKLDHGMMYEGPWGGLGTWTPIDVPDQLVSGAVANTIAHSTMGDLVVGNYDIAGKPGSGNGFIYDIRTGAYTLLTIGEFATAYGIWQNGGSTSSSYTIAGGYKGGKGLNVGFLVNYDSSTGQFTGLSDFGYDNNPGIVTHFEGITGVPGGYTLAATGDNGAAFAAIASNGNGKFGVPKWVAIKYDASRALHRQFDPRQQPDRNLSARGRWRSKLSRHGVRPRRVAPFDG